MILTTYFFEGIFIKYQYHLNWSFINRKFSSFFFFFFFLHQKLSASGICSTGESILPVCACLCVDSTIRPASSLSSSLTSCFSVSLPAEQQKDDEQNRRREMDEWCSHYCSLHLSPGGGEKKRESCNRPLYISGQMRGVWVLLVWVCPEERNMREQEEHFTYSKCIQASVWIYSFLILWIC